MSLPSILSALLVAGLSFATVPAASADLSLPADPVILSVGGDIRVTNSGGEAHFDRAMIEELGLAELRTETPWTEGTQTFQGVTLEHLMDVVGARGTIARAEALNDYAVDIELNLATSSNALIAVKMNGEYMSVRDKGPLWIVFPWGAVSKQHEELFKAQSVWQLRRLDIR